jgi:hypothetical protein
MLNHTLKPKNTQLDHLKAHQRRYRSSHSFAQRAHRAQTKYTLSASVTPPRFCLNLENPTRLAFDKTDMDWLKGELRDIKFEIGEVRSSMLGIAERLRNEEDFALEHILYPI